MKEYDRCTVPSIPPIGSTQPVDDEDEDQGNEDESEEVVMKKKMNNKMVVMISLEKRGLQKIPPIGRNANADHPSRASGLCHFSKRPLRSALTCPTRKVLIS